MPVPHSTLLAPLRDALDELVEATGAIDGALGVGSGYELRLVASMRGRFSRRTISGSSCRPLAAAIGAGGVSWLGPGAAEGLYLPPHTQVLYLPLAKDGVTGAALLAYDHRVSLSAEDWSLVRRAFSPPPPALRPVGDLQLAA